MKCDIAIPIWNKKELTERCVESILFNTSFPYRIILIDNGSKEPTRSYLKGLSIKYPEKVKLIVNRENLGNTAAGNQGMKYSGAEYVCILDNDTIVCKDWLSEMVRVANLSSNIGIVNPSSNSFGTRPKKGQSLEEFSSGLNIENSGKYTEVGAAVGFCYLVKRKVINEIGCWDERFSPGYFEDTEYSMRAKKFGYRSVIALGSYVYHEEHASFKSKEKKKEFEELFKQSREKFHALHGKPKRSLYVISKKDARLLTLLKERAYRDADAGNWENIFIKETAGDIEFARHGNIKKVILKPSFFDIKILWRVLTKKKKFDRIYGDDTRLLKTILFFKKIHRAEVKLLKG